MELHTVSQVSRTFGISTRMLRYYEESGLLKSQRKEGYSYRVYDDENIKRLQQIIILRKLQIPVKHISIILNNPDAATALDIFEKNINEIQNEITALETIKSAIEIFVSKIKELAAVRFNMNLLTDDSVLKLAESLSLIQKNVKENRIVEELNRASETLDKSKEKNVRVVKLPPSTMAYLFCEVKKDNPDYSYEVWGIAKDIMGKFIEDVDLIRVKPDFRYFQGGNAEGTNSWIRITIPDDLEVLPPLKKITHPGGLYAAYMSTPENGDDGNRFNVAWAENSEEYEWRSGKDGEARFQECLNVYNIYGLKNSNLEYWDYFLPIREIKKITDEQKEELNTAVQNAEKLASQNKPTEVDLKTMKQTGEFDLKYEGDLMKFKVDVDNHSFGMKTSQQFKLPLKIELYAKTDGKDIRIHYAKGKIIFNWFHIRSTLVISEILNGQYSMHKKLGEIPVDEFVLIEWIFYKDIMAVKVNGEIRYTVADCDYIKAFKENPEFNLSSPITITGAMGSTVTVEKLRITEI